MAKTPKKTCRTTITRVMAARIDGTKRHTHTTAQGRCPLSIMVTTIDGLVRVCCLYCIGRDRDIGPPIEKTPRLQIVAGSNREKVVSSNRYPPLCFSLCCPRLFVCMCDVGRARRGYQWPSCGKAEREHGRDGHR